MEYTATSPALRILIVHGTATSPDGIALKTTREGTVSLYGNVVLETSEAYTGGAYAQIDWAEHWYDEFGRETAVQRSNGTTAATEYVDCCRKRNVTDETGTLTIYQQDVPLSCIIRRISMRIA